MKKETNKNDRRYAYTHNVIKDAMLELLHSTGFEEVTVSGLCRQAQVGRATFYTHYDNLMEVIEELVDDAIKATDRSVAASIDGIKGAARYLRTEQGFEEMESQLLLLPICQRVADNPKYNVLFQDSALSDYILSMIYRQERDYQMMLFTYMLTGAFAVNKAMGWKKGKDWMRVQRIILNFVSGGMDAVNKLPK